VRKFYYVYTQRLLSHLQYITTLPSESGKSQKNVTHFDSIFKKLLTFFLGHFEQLI